MREGSKGHCVACTLDFAADTKIANNLHICLGIYKHVANVPARALATD